MSERGDDPPERAEEFIQLFNRVAEHLTQLVNPQRFVPFNNLVDVASARSAAVRANALALRQFAMLRNAIVHDPGYPPHIAAVPSAETLSKFNRVAQKVLEPARLIPTFETQVRCFLVNESLQTALRFMRERDFSQVMVWGGDKRLRMLTVEGITWWLADNVRDDQNPVNTAVIGDIIALEPPGGFIVMGPDRTIFDAADAFRNVIDREATRLYAIVITGSGGDTDTPVGFITPWDMVHNSRLQ